MNAQELESHQAGWWEVVNDWPAEEVLETLHYDEHGQRENRQIEPVSRHL